MRTRSRSRAHLMCRAVSRKFALSTGHPPASALRPIASAVVAQNMAKKKKTVRLNLSSPPTLSDPPRKASGGQIFTAESTMDCNVCRKTIKVGTGGEPNLILHQTQSKDCRDPGRKITDMFKLTIECAKRGCETGWVSGFAASPSGFNIPTVPSGLHESTWILAQNLDLRRVQCRTQQQEAEASIVDSSFQ
jgi:hypothetical protein